jgi:predicted dienelactone hydrolase
MKPAPMNAARRRFVSQSALAAASIAALALMPRARASDAPAFEAFDLDWRDAGRQREVPVRLYLPAGAAHSPQRLPLVVFSHGIGGSRRGYSWVGRHFASHGVMSLHLQHIGSDNQMWRGNPIEIFQRWRGAAQDSEAIARVHDLRFALDTLLGGEWGARIDPTRIVAAGHSYGANTSLLAAGARVQRQGRAVELRDERVRAAILISSPPFYGESDPFRILAPISVPTLHVTATEDTIKVPGYYSGVDDRIEVFDATGGRAGPPKWLAVYEGGSHGMFTDRSGSGGASLNPQVKAATQELALAFLRGVFDGDTAALAAWPKRHFEILARFSAVA